MHHRLSHPASPARRDLGGSSPAVALMGAFCGVLALFSAGHVASARTTATQPGTGTAVRIYDLPVGASPKLGLADVNTRVYVPPPDDLLLEKKNQFIAEALAHYALGGILQDLGEEERALEHFSKVLDLDPTQHDLANRVAAIQVRRGDIPRALNVLKDSIKANPDQPSTYRFLSFLYHRYQNKTDLAISYAEKAIQISPADFETHRTLYDIYESEGESAKALGVLKAAADRDINDGAFWVQVGKALRNHVMTHPSQDEAADARLLDQIFAKAEANADGNVAILDQVATYHVTNRQIDKAVALYRKILELDGSVMMVREKLAEALLGQGKQSEALDVLEGTAQIDPYRYDNFERLGNMYFDAASTAASEEDRLWNYEKALKHYARCLQLNPHAVQMYERVCRLQMRTGAFTEAVTTARQARERFTDNPFFIYLLASAQTAAEQYEEALKTFEEAEERLRDTRRNMLTAEFYFEYGAAAERSKQYERAAELFRRSIALNPEFAQPYNYLGYMWIDANQNLEEAVALVRRALDLEPENSAYLDSLGWYYYRKGEYEEALNYLKQSAARLEEPSWEIHDHLGDTYDKLGQPEDAQREWRDALKLDIDNEAIRKKLSPDVVEKIAAEVEAEKNAPKKERTPPKLPDLPPAQADDPVGTDDTLPPLNPPTDPVIQPRP